ncbi:MAG TPA: ankyrin repeat domain-containing protein [Terracidiphilus sp.]|nr:ankyrin repeat domain-containing protein [Terracidiphilus sp.]
MQAQLPLRPSLEQLRKQAKSLLKRQLEGDAEALARVREAHPRLRNVPGEQIAASPFTLADAQLVIASEYGFASWPKLQSHVKTLEAAGAAAEAGAALRDAAGRGDLARINALLDAHPELIDERGGEGVRTPLHHAVFGNSEASVKLLLERGANPNVRCEGDNAYPLHFALEKHRFPIIRLLVEHGADTVGEGDYHELGVIGWATAWDYIQADPEIVAYLLAHGAQHNIFSAVAVGDTESIRELVRRTPGDLEKRMNGTKMRRMPLHLAVVKKQTGSLLTLLDLGANLESIDEARFTALDLAALDGDAGLVQILLDRGAQVRLPAAVALGRTRDIERLLREDPDALKPGCRWANLIVRAAERGTGEVVEILIRNGASVNVHDSPQTSIDSTSGYTPLHGAAWYGNLSAIDVLMKHGADVRAHEEKYHGTPAGWADYSGHKEARDRILRGPVDIIDAIQYNLLGRVKAVLDEDPAALNRTFHEYGLFPLDAEGWQTPLAYAALRGRADAVRLLIGRGADAALRSPKGETLSAIAQKAGHHEVALILDEQGERNKNESREKREPAR